jgi:flavin-dependent dehydrogenase
MDYDVLIIGAGPAGAVAALRSAQLGLKAVAFEKGRHPRFHIGESLLPRMMTLVRKLGLEDGLKALPHVFKVGGSFAFAHEMSTTDYHFARGFLPVNHETLNIERGPFDTFLCRAAREAGSEIHEDAAVRQIVKLEEGRVELVVEQNGAQRHVTGRWLIDASGQGAVVGRHLGLRRMLPDLRKVASYGHFENVWRPAGVLGGYPQILMCDEGWFWFIPLDEKRTSIGLVLSAEVAKKVDVPADKLVFWGIERSPLPKKWTENAVFPEQTWVSADFSYTCRPFAGPGYFMVGDAATFVDPIFSTGVTLGMMTANEAIETIVAIESGAIGRVRARRRYCAFVEAGSSSFFRLVRGFYHHTFRELFLHNLGPFRLHSAVNSVLTGNVFPDLTWSLRWRMALFEFFMKVQRVVPLVRRRTGWSLLSASPTPSESH